MSQAMQWAQPSPQSADSGFYRSQPAKRPVVSRTRQQVGWMGRQTGQHLHMGGQSQHLYKGFVTLTHPHLQDRM